MVLNLQSNIQLFHNYLYQVGYAKKTQHQLKSMILEFVSHQNITCFTEVNQHHIKNFYCYLQTRPLRRRDGSLSPSTIRQFVFALKTFFEWMERSGQIKYNPVSGIKFIRKSNKRTRHPLSATEINQLFSAAENLKERALLHLFYSCGLRRSEAMLLNTRDIDFTEGLLYVRKGKGAKRRVIPLTKNVIGDFEEYFITTRSKQKYKDRLADDAFMLTYAGRRMGCNSYYRQFKKILGNSGIEKQEISLHHLRHSISTHLLHAGMPMELVRDFLGHSELSSTLIYAKADKAQIRSI
ncbi:tyrosine-type recombinase/integrase [Foetidibacter luteolus]|uniref:tyrosine-type recombinase/integrase n=1 Tax=Foetidibacter luteolus TaxID=2608880 RepID=UPI00129B6CE5|nr:tyrosine-type recombinase/integrase [Foetidibacter luteolus]